jgi:hypothetical protein
VQLGGEERVAVGLAVGGQQADGVGVGLDGAWALVLGFHGAPEAAVEEEEGTSGQLPVGGYRSRERHRSPH